MENIIVCNDYVLISGAKIIGLNNKSAAKTVKGLLTAMGLKPWKEIYIDYFCNCGAYMLLARPCKCTGTNS